MINTLILLGIILILSILIIVKIKGKQSIQIMLLGIELTLVAGILAVDQNTNLGGIEYLLLLFGLIINIVGFLKPSRDSS